MTLMIRRAVAEDARPMARVHVDGWRHTYGRVTSAADREQFWTGALTGPRWSANTAAVAEHDGVVVGIAMAGPVEEPAWSHHLHLIYVDRDHHGSGAAAALLHAVLDPRVAAALWVADPNPRAQAFYAKLGFAPDGTVRWDDGFRELRWVRPVRSGPEYVRRTARVLLLDAADRVLLLKVRNRETGGVDWYTPGGGVEPGETVEQTAVREVFEEAGLVTTVDALTPVATTSGWADWTWLRGRVRDDFFLLRVTEHTVDTSGWTEWERQDHEGFRWWSLEELRETRDRVFPPGLVDLLTDPDLGRGRIVDLPWPVGR